MLLRKHLQDAMLGRVVRDGFIVVAFYLSRALLGVRLEFVRLTSFFLLLGVCCWTQNRLARGKCDNFPQIDFGVLDFVQQHA